MTTPKMCPALLKSLSYHVPNLHSSFCNGSWIICTWFKKCSHRWGTMRIIPTSAYKDILNLLHSQCKSPTYFGHLSWISSERCFTKDILQGIPISVYKYKYKMCRRFTTFRI
jgi:hypothetical protein